MSISDRITDRCAISMGGYVERHKRQVGRFYDEIWNRRDISVVAEILTPDVTFRGSLGLVVNGRAEFAD